MLKLFGYFNLILIVFVFNAFGQSFNNDDPLTLIFEYTISDGAPNGCHQEVFKKSPEPNFVDGTCIIEFKSNACAVDNVKFVHSERCNATTTIAIDTEFDRKVKYFRDVLSDPIQGTCFPVTTTQKIITSDKVINTKETGELCVVSDEPGIPGVTIYLDSNGNGFIEPDSRLDVPDQLIASSNGVVLEGENNGEKVVKLVLNVKVNRIDLN